jgi:hypothetical protein
VLEISVDYSECYQSQDVNFLEEFLDFRESIVAGLFSTDWQLVWVRSCLTFTPQDFFNQ